MDSVATTARVRVWESFDEFNDLWPRTDRLGSSACYAFQCADILAVWNETIGALRRVEFLPVEVFGPDGRPVALLPLCIERRHGVRVLTFVDGGVCDYNGPILFADADKLGKAALERIWRDLVRALPRFDVAILEKMPLEIGGATNPLIGLGARRYGPSGHVLEVRGSWQGFASKRLPRRQNSRRLRRRLAEVGHVTFLVAQTEAERERIFLAIVRHRATRRGSGLPYENYFRELNRQLVPAGCLHVAALLVDDQIIAAHWGFVVGKRFYYLIPAFDASWAKFAPGRLLLENLLEWCFDNGVEVFDFGIGDESYKCEYGAQTLPLYRSVLPVTLVGQAYSGGLRAKIRLSSLRARATSCAQRLLAKGSRSSDRWLKRLPPHPPRFPASTSHRDSIVNVT